MMDRFQSTKTIEDYQQKSKIQILQIQQLNRQECFARAHKRDHPKNIEVLALDTLDSILHDFFTETNKKDGKDYRPSSLAAMQGSVDRYLCESNYKYSILNSRFFKRSRDVLEVRAPLLRKK